MLTYVWGSEEEEISCEEFPFENFNNLTSCNALILFKADPSRKYLERVCRLEVLKNSNCLSLS